MYLHKQHQFKKEVHPGSGVFILVIYPWDYMDLCIQRYKKLAKKGVLVKDLKTVKSYV